MRISLFNSNKILHYKVKFRTVNLFDTVNIVIIVKLKSRRFQYQKCKFLND